MTVGDNITFSIPVTNIGPRDGAEVVQLYISDLKSSLPRPIKELKGFEKTMLKAGETKTITFTISNEDLSFFDDTKHQWIAEPGIFEIQIGAASDDIRSSFKFNLD